MAATAAGSPREASLGYLAQIARAAETVGFEGALTPTGAWCEDAWLTTAMRAAESERLKFLVAFRPGGVSPTLAAQMGATLQGHSGGRLLVNVVTGGEPTEQRAYGDFLDKDERYTRTGEFLDVVRRLWAGEEVTLDGEQVHVDVYLTWGEPPEQVAEKIEWIRGLAAAHVSCSPATRTSRRPTGSARARWPSSRAARAVDARRRVRSRPRGERSRRLGAVRRCRAVGGLRRTYERMTTAPVVVRTSRPETRSVGRSVEAATLTS